MQKNFIAILKIILPLGLGLFLIWLVFKDLTPVDIAEIKQSFNNINYIYLIISVFFGVISHLSRAWRWKYPLNHLGYQPKLHNSFFSTMIGYFANLGIPRSGELLRCGVMSKYEDIPFNKLVGTVIAERMADLLVLCSFIAMVFFLQIDLLTGYLKEIGFFKQISFTKMFILGAAFFVVVIVSYLVLKRSKLSFFEKLRKFLSGIKQGLIAILTMPNRGKFILHTIFIWGMYFLMFYITIFSLPEVETLPISGIVTAFVLGGISIAATNGGIGAYPLAISSVLMLYGVDHNIGYAFGWATWIAQTAMIIIVGLISLILVPKLNEKQVKQFKEN